VKLQSVPSQKERFYKYSQYRGANVTVCERKINATKTVKNIQVLNLNVTHKKSPAEHVSAGLFCKYVDRLFVVFILVGLSRFGVALLDAVTHGLGHV